MRTAVSIVMVFVMFGIVGFAPNAFAEDVASVEVRVISATQSGKSFDSNLSDIKQKLKRAFAGYSNFKELNRKVVTLKKGDGKSVSLPNGSNLTVTFFKRQGKSARLGLGIPKKLKTTVIAPPGGTLFQAGLSYKGGVLILAITLK